MSGLPPVTESNDRSTDRAYDRSNSRPPRTAALSRQTGETDIAVSLNLDGSGAADLSTGIGFFDHMLHLMACHGRLDLAVRADRGDLAVDGHHLVEDVGIVLGQALRLAAADKAGIRRYGAMLLPMDETLTRVALDFSGRPYLVFKADFKAPMVGAFDTQLTREFFQAVAVHASLTLHIETLSPGNTHHEIEGMFKAFGRALRQALSYDEREPDIPSSKGVL